MPSALCFQAGDLSAARLVNFGRLAMCECLEGNCHYEQPTYGCFGSAQRGAFTAFMVLEVSACPAGPPMWSARDYANQQGRLLNFDS
jgi:hypothetical protein